MQSASGPPVWTSLEIARDRAERVAETGANCPHDGDRGNCDERRQQTVFDRCNAALILDQTRDDAQHLFISIGIKDSY
jgi:hypothetical protein